MGEQTVRDLKSLRARMNGNFWPIVALSVLGVGGGGGLLAMKNEATAVNKELVEYKLEQLSQRLDRIERLLEERLPPR